MFSLPHPILASEDDEEYVIRTILGLPEIVEEFFESLEAHFIEGQDCKGKANLLFFRLQRELEVLDNVRSSCYWTYDLENGTATHDKELPKMLVRLSRLFLEDVVAVNPTALSWKKPCVQLAHDCAEHMQGGRVRFPWYVKLRRKLITFNSNSFIFSLILFSLIVLFNAVLVVVLPATRPKIAVGVSLGSVAAALLIATSVIVNFHFVCASRALYNLYNRILQENMAYNINNGNDQIDNKKGGNLTNAGFIGAGRVKISRGRSTKKGYYTIPYNGNIGYIDGRQLDSQVVMIAFDEQFLITRWNSAAEVMTGFLEDGCVGKPINELVSSPNGGDICEELKRAHKSDLIKIKLRALAMAPTTLHTIVAPIVNTEGNKVGSILICANAKDNLREYRTYIHNYQIFEIKESLSQMMARGTHPREEVSALSSLKKFSANCVANRVEELAREMVSDWEWTNRERLLGRALGSSASLHEVVVDPLFPQTLCVNPLVPNTLGLIVSVAGGRCAIRLNISNYQNNLFYLSIVVKTDKGEKLWDVNSLEESLLPLLRSTAGNVYFHEDEVILHFPCQIAPILEDDGEDDATTSEQAQQLTRARAIINCSVNVVTLINNIVDQHNISLLLLKTMFVSLTGIREKSDLEQRLQAKTVDVVVCDRDWLRECSDLLLSKDHGAIIIPVIGAKEVPPQNFEYVFRLPLVGRDVQETMVTVGTAVSKKKNAITAQEERERILTLRQDSPWTKGKLLGRGSYGAVYEATSDLTGGKMAVKMFYFVSDSESSIDKLLNEIQIMCSLNHPNIVHYFHCERKDNNVSLFMELCLCSLTDLIVGNRKKPPHLTVVNIVKQVLTAIAYLHSRGTAHRDIKPQNILLKDESGLIKITDFGTARQGASSKEVKGTFRYMAPEVYKGLPHSLPCDIWSIGCLVCELFACPPKFMDVPTLLGEMTSVSPYLEMLPNNSVLRDFVYKCFKLDPALRPTSRVLLTHPLLTSSIETDVENLPTVFDVTRSNKTQESVFSIAST